MHVRRSAPTISFVQTCPTRWAIDTAHETDPLLVLDFSTNEDWELFRKFMLQAINVSYDEASRRHIELLSYTDTMRHEGASAPPSYCLPPRYAPFATVEQTVHAEIRPEDASSVGMSQCTKLPSTTSESDNLPPHYRASCVDTAHEDIPSVLEKSRCVI